MRTRETTAAYARLTEGGGSLAETAMEKLTAGAPPRRSLSEIGAEIRDLSAGARAMSLWFAVEIGRRLTEAKAVCPHGEWLDFLRRETEYSERKAQTLMQVFEGYGARQGSIFGAELANPQTYADLSFSKALALLAIEDEDQRAEFVEAHDVTAMSTRELKEALRDRDEARQALAQAQRSAEAAQAAAAEAEAAEAEAAAEASRLREQVRTLEARPVATVTDPEETARAVAEAVAAAGREHEARQAGLEQQIAKLQRDLAKSEQTAAAGKEAEALRGRVRELQAALTAQQEAGAAETAALKKRLAAADGPTAAFRACFLAWQRAYSAVAEALGALEPEQARNLRAAVAVQIANWGKEFGDHG